MNVIGKPVGEGHDPESGRSATGGGGRIATSSHLPMLIFVGVLYDLITRKSLCRDHVRVSIGLSVT